MKKTIWEKWAEVNASIAYQIQIMAAQVDDMKKELDKRGKGDKQ